MMTGPFHFGQLDGIRACHHYRIPSELHHLVHHNSKNGKYTAPLILALLRSKPKVGGLYVPAGDNISAPTNVFQHLLDSTERELAVANAMAGEVVGCRI